MNYNREVHNYINIAKKTPQQQQEKQTTKTSSSYHAGFYQIPFYEEIWSNLGLFWEEFLQANCYQW